MYKYIKKMKLKEIFTEPLLVKKNVWDNIGKK